LKSKWLFLFSVKNDDYSDMKKYNYFSSFATRSYEEIRLISKYFNEMSTTLSFNTYLDTVLMYNKYNIFTREFWQTTPNPEIFRDLVLQIGNQSKPILQFIYIRFDSISFI